MTNWTNLTPTKKNKKKTFFGNNHSTPWLLMRCFRVSILQSHNIFLRKKHLIVLGLKPIGLVTVFVSYGHFLEMFTPFCDKSCDKSCPHVTNPAKKKKKWQIPPSYDKKPHIWQTLKYLHHACDEQIQYDNSHPYVTKPTHILKTKVNTPVYINS